MITLFNHRKEGSEQKDKISCNALGEILYIRKEKVDSLYQIVI